jgi:hypothetical protein
MQNAAGIAGAEARFIRQVNLADEHWSNRRYEPAANAYAEAWEASPGRSEVGMRAATGFLMVDKVDLAVTVLSRLRASAPPELSTKAAAMLRELAAISEYGKREVDRTVVSEAQLPEDPAVRIRREVGSISSDEVVIAARPDPALLSDTTAVAGEASLVGQDAEINGHETFYDSKTSVFGLYQSTAAPAAPVEPPHAAAPAMPQLTLPPQAHAVEVPPQPPPVAAPKGAEQAVEVITRPAQASVTLDKDERPVACTTPCKVSLSAGRHTLLAKLAGYRDAHRIFEVSRSMKPLELELEAKRGTVNIESVPSQLPVFVDGSKTGQSTPVLMPLSEGNHKIGVESEGQLWTKDVAVSDGAIFTTTIQAGAK